MGFFIGRSPHKVQARIAHRCEKIQGLLEFTLPFEVSKHCPLHYPVNNPDKEKIVVMVTISQYGSSDATYPE